MKMNEEQESQRDRKVEQKMGENAKNVYETLFNTQDHLKHAFAINLILCSVNYCFIMSLSSFFPLFLSLFRPFGSVFSAQLFSSALVEHEISQCAKSMGIGGLFGKCFCRFLRDESDCVSSVWCSISFCFLSFFFSYFYLTIHHLHYELLFYNC